LAADEKLTEAYSIPPQKFISQFKNISPDITSAFFFKKNGEIDASNKATTADQIKKLIAG